jgi:hypothetical protein
LALNHVRQISAWGRARTVANFDLEGGKLTLKVSVMEADRR